MFKTRRRLHSRPHNFFRIDPILGGILEAAGQVARSSIDYKQQPQSASPPDFRADRSAHRDVGSGATRRMGAALETGVPGAGDTHPTARQQALASQHRRQHSITAHW